MGLLVFFSPAGIGVRDGIYSLFLSPLIGAEMVAIVVVCMRVTVNRNLSSVCRTGWVDAVSVAKGSKKWQLKMLIKLTDTSIKS